MLDNCLDDNIDAPGLLDRLKTGYEERLDGFKVWYGGIRYAFRSTLSYIKENKTLRGVVAAYKDGIAERELDRGVFRYAPLDPESLTEEQLEELSKLFHGLKVLT